MRSIGFRCNPHGFAFVVLEGETDAPIVLGKGHPSAPKGMTRCEELQWLRQEIHGLLDEYQPDAGFFKGMEATSRNVSVSRVEYEGVLQEAGLSHEQRLEIARRIKVQISKHLGFKGKPRYVMQSMDDSLGELGTATYEEAAAAAMCGLPRPSA